MQPNPPPGLPSHTLQAPARSGAPALPAERSAARPGPLPDPAAIRQVPVPDAAPPYDGEDAGLPGAASCLPGGPPAGPPDQADTPRRQPEVAGWSARAAPGPGGWPGQFAQALAEALAGSRPAQQLTPWTTEQARKRIRQLGPLLATGQRPRLRRLMTSAPACDVLELTAVVGFGPRVRVLALRLERIEEPGEHWRCTEIESA